MQDKQARRDYMHKVLKANQSLTAHPRSIDEVIKVMTHPKKFPSPVRPVGSDSATTRVNRAQHGTVLDMTRMNRILKLGKESVTVQAGVRLHELATLLADDGLELTSGSDLPDRTVGGAISSCMLSAGIPGEDISLAASVSSIIIVSPAGEKIEIRETHERYMKLFRMSYGLTGVICHVTLKVRPIRSYQVNTTKLVLEELAAVAGDLKDVPVGVKMHIMPFRNRAWVELRRPCKEQKPIRNLPWKIKEWARSSAMPKVVNSVNKAFSVSKIRDPLIDGVTEATQKLFIGNFGDYANNALELSGKFNTLRQRQADKVGCSWAFPESEFNKVLAAFRNFSLAHYKHNGFRCDLPATAYRINQDQESLLSPSFEGAVYILKLESTNAQGWDDFVLDLADFASGFSGIPIFNQTRSFTPEHAKDAFGMRLKAFSNARLKIDPEGRLLNQFFSEYMSQ